MDENLRRILGLPDEAEVEAQREKTNAKIMELFVSGLHDNVGPPLLRAIVENNEWFVAVKPETDNDSASPAFEMIDVPPGQYRLALQYDQQSKKRTKGRGGRLLSIYTQKPTPSTICLDGCALVRALPAKCDGLLLHFPDQAPKELGGEFFDELLTLTKASDLEGILTAPAAGQIEDLRSSIWWVEMRDGRPHRQAAVDGQVIQAYTHPDRAGLSMTPVEKMRGEQLFRFLIDDAYADGILVNERIEMGHGDFMIRNLLLSPGFAHRLLAGEDPRPGARPLPARSLEEIEVWLNTRRFPHRARKWVDSPYPDHTLLRVKAIDDIGWRMQETSGKQRQSQEPTWSPVFILPPGVERQEVWSELGSGPTRILCAGLLAKELNADCHGSQDVTRYGKEGRKILFGRLLDEYDQENARRRLALALELLKILPSGADQIPRSALLTVEGVTILRRHPHAAARAWIEGTVRQAERYTKRWIWN